MTLALCAAVCAAMTLCIIFFPRARVGNFSFDTYWPVALLGALLVFAVGALDFGTAFSAMTADTAINPIKIAVLFLSMTVLSVYLDEVGFFGYVASVALARAGRSQTRLFFILYGAVSLLTLFTSNDIVILTFTPFICHFAKSARIDPLPYLVSEFVAANTWSMALIIGNPTNIYLMSGTGVSFLSYTAKMIIPTAMAGLVSLGVLYLIFRKKLKAPLNPEDSPAPTVDLPTEVIGLVHLGGCILLLSVSSFLSLPMWLITCLFFLSLVVFTMAIGFFRRRSVFLIARCIIRAPWDLAPFVISMFILVLALDKYGITGALGGFLSQPETLGGTVASFGVSSFFAANVVNNIPMSVLYSSVIGGMEASPLTVAALFSAVIGSNLGAFFTPTGALAGIMWTGQLHDHGVSFSFTRFVKYGATVAVPAMAAALLGLWLCL